MKYMGNKQKIADEILTVIFNDSKKTDTFVDLFCGSCSVIERVPDSYIKIANDKNKFLIEMFKSLVNGNEYPKIITKNDYDARRNLYNLSKRYLVLTDKDYAEIGWYGWMASFNGRFFSGGYSGHNVLQKNGKTRDYIKEQINNTLKTIPKLKNVNFTSDDYFNVDIPEGSIVYCDIPYKDSKQYETSKNFDYEKFYEWCRKNKSKYQIFISEYNMPEDFKCIWQKEVTNSMNTTKTYKPIEKLFILE